MRINFIPNPRFTPAKPKIGVGSVVMCGDRKAMVIEVDDSHYPYKVAPRINGLGEWFAKSYLKVLPERVCGWNENGPMFEPMVRPAPSFSWDQYPPRAGMVVECLWCDQTPNGDLRLLFESSKGFGPVSADLTLKLESANESNLRFCYLPRPDLMPQFVEGE